LNTEAESNPSSRALEVPALPEKYENINSLDELFAKNSNLQLERRLHMRKSLEENTSLTGPGVSQEINLPRLVEVVKEAVRDLPIRPIAQVAAVGATAAVVGGSVLFTIPLELKNISPEGLEVDEYGCPTAPYVSPTDPHNFIDKK
jgi:hypothetical protein